MGYDGSVNIDTKLDTKGFNKGTKSISSSLSGVMKSVTMVAKAMAAAFIGGSIISAIRSVIGSFDLMNSSIGGSLKTLNTSFAALKSSFASLVLTAFAPMIPYIITAVNWLTKLFTTLAQVTAALFGVQVAMAGLKDETAGTGKEAKKAAGALAGFDQLNVLSQQDPGAGAGGLLPSSLVPTELLDKVQAFKEKMLTFLQPVIDALGRLKDALLPLGMTIWEGLKWAWDNILVPLGTWAISDLLPAFLDLLASAADVLNAALLALAPLWQAFFDNFLKPLAEWAGGKIIEFLDWLTLKLGELAVWINDNPEKFKSFITIIGILFLAIATIFATIVAFTSGIGALTGLAIAAVIGFIILVISQWKNMGETIKQIGFIISYYVGLVSESIKDAFNNALNAVKEKFTSIFNGIKDIVKSVLNTIIDYINGMINAVTSGINSIVSGANTIGALIPGYEPISEISTPQIPRLATGAVIPPNSQFAAILGDQRNGKNIEAPEGLIRQIVREEMQNSSGGDVTIPITLTLDGEVVYKNQQRISRRNGKSLLAGGMA